ncbi:probable polysaccharide transport protein [Geminocystis sp. NIES-3708]|nr:oligosaccharide flippase family protein [Geminocystis sp. NIES-3708]BAQ61806.1 probable polysaccharide transport protein [Geminocystis sp. NIES-3708]
MTIAGILLTIISFFLAENIVILFHQPRLTFIIQCFFFLFIINSFGHVFQAIKKKELRFKILAVRSLIVIIISGFLHF